ncbi:MAG: tail fiber domain-containing protein [Sulfuritalea sp.]|nr:tail fiber domain-containing protein [Sulfuritalea sp.]
MSRFREALRMGVAPGSLLWATRLNDMGKGDAPAAPDYTPVANASKESAQIMADQGDRVLAETKRQYDQNVAVAKPVADAQLGMMRQSIDQGNDYYQYMKDNQRPVETALNAESMRDTTSADAAERDAILTRQLTNAGQDDTERALITGGDQGVYDARKADIEGGVGTAVADVRNGQTTAANMLLRQGMRYGYSPAKMATMAGTTAGANASAVAAAANGARTTGIDRSRALLSDSYNMRNATNAGVVNAMTTQRGMRIQDNATGWAKKMDVAGLYRGMPGASTGAYSVATGAGNSAVNNTMAPGTAMVNGTTTAANLTGTGRSLLQSGLGTVAGMQANNYNTAQNSPSPLGGIGSMLGGAASLYSAFSAAAPLAAASSKKLKTDKKPVSAELITRGLQRIPVEAWKYKDGEGDGGEHIGPYAEDVQREFGDRAAPGGKKIDLVTMNGLALAGIKSLADRLDKMEHKIGMRRREP